MTDSIPQPEGETPSVPPPHPFVLGRSDVARRLGVPPKTVDTWRERGKFIEPTWLVGGRAAWDWDRVKEWDEERRFGIPPRPRPEIAQHTEWEREQKGPVPVGTLPAEITSLVGGLPGEPSLPPPKHKLATDDPEPEVPVPGSLADDVAFPWRTFGRDAPAPEVEAPDHDPGWEIHEPDEPLEIAAEAHVFAEAPERRGCPPPGVLEMMASGSDPEPKVSLPVPTAVVPRKPARKAVAKKAPAKKAAGVTTPDKPRPSAAAQRAAQAGCDHARAKWKSHGYATLCACGKKMR